MFFFYAQKQEGEREMAETAIVFGVFSVICGLVSKVDKHCKREDIIMKKVFNFCFIITSIFALL